MRIAIDYDGTFSKDPRAFFDALQIFREAGHAILGVTCRHPEMKSDVHSLYFLACHQVIYTSGEFKKEFVEAKGLSIDVWIDDAPEMIIPMAGIGDRSEVA